ncbi:MAG: OB-fold nucleic acid binding domain-containing protein, partial [Bryobacteraceae bacterium]
MSLEFELLAQRLEKVRQIRALGFEPYGQRFDFTHTLVEIRRRWGDKSAEELEPRITVRVCGRIHTLRLMGRAGFAHLMQEGERLQIYVRSDAVCERDWKLFRMLEPGDIIGAEGY